MRLKTLSKSTLKPPLHSKKYLRTNFVAHTAHPVVLEVEPAETPMAQRRIVFYQRHGFHLSAIPYVQPPYRKEDQPLPLCLMTTDNQYLTAHADAVIRQIHSAVYGVESR